MPVPWRSGTITTGAVRASSASTSSGSSAGQSPGTSNTRSAGAPTTTRRPGTTRAAASPASPAPPTVSPAPASAAATPRAAASDWPRSAGSCTTWTPRSVAIRAAIGSAVTTITPSSEGTAASASSTSATIAAARAGRSGNASPSRCLARLKDLTGRIATVRMRTVTLARRANSSTAARHAPARLGVAELDVGLQRRHEVGALIGHEPVDQAGRSGRRCRRSPASGRPR